MAFPAFPFWVSRIKSTGNPELFGTVEIAVGAGLSIGQVGQVITLDAAGGSGDVVGPANAANGEIVIFDGTTGKLIKKNGPLGLEATIVNGAIVVPAGLTIGSQITIGTLPGEIVNWAAGLNVNTPAVPAVVTDWLQITTAGGTRFIPMMT